jgi:hypothetical protein
MRLKHIAAAFAFAGAVGLLTVPADSQPRRDRVVTRGDRTVSVSRDESGRTRTRIIIQKRSYLDPGTETFPGERRYNEYSFLPGQHADDVLNNTTFGGNQQPLPGPFTLPSKRNPWLEY